MKKGLIFVLFALVSIVSYSQISWNAKVGMNMSNITDSEMDMKIGFQAGVGMEYAFSDMWSIRPSLMFTTKGAKLSEEGVDVTYNPMYLELPVMAAASFAIADDQNIVVKAGPYFAFGIAGKAKFSADGESEKIDLFGDGEDQMGMKRFDAGGVGVAYEISKFFVDLTGEFGLTKVAGGDGSPKNMNFSIGVGYKF
jgi:opacity protein-like surface antigen